jgi:hypothetical protein
MISCTPGSFLRKDWRTHGCLWNWENIFEVNRRHVLIEFQTKLLSAGQLPSLKFALSPWI